MADKIDINLEENSPYRVALDLVHDIAKSEGRPVGGADRKYWLTLYEQCRRVVVDGRSAKDVLKGLE